MDKVVRYEEGRVWRWRRRYVLTLIILLCILAGGIYGIARSILDLRTYELFSLFREDWEIISEY